MAISDRITSIEEHIKESYQELEGIGIDTTGVNKNLENIPKLIDGYWETLPKVTEEGTSITLDNTKEGKMKINLKGNTSQESTTGKNMIDIPTTTYTMNNYYYRDVGTGIQITSGMVGKSYSFSYDIDISSITTTVSGVSGVVGRGTTAGAMAYQIKVSTFPAEVGKYHVKVENFSISNEWVGQYIVVRFIGFAQPSTTTYTYSNVQFEQSTTATSYEPYTNGASPNPDYPQDIHVVSGDNSINVCGKNLVDYDNNTNLENKVLNASGVFESSSYTYINGTIKTSNNKITISFNNRMGDAYVRIGEYKIDGTFIKRTLVTTTPTTLTLDNNTSYIIYSIDKRSGVYFDKLQIEMNDQATTYEAYTGESYPISLGVENLFDLPNEETLNGITYTKNANGSINLIGTATTNTSFMIYKDLATTSIINGNTYTLSATQSLPSGIEIRLEAYNDTTWLRHVLNSTLNSTQQKITNNANTTSATRIRYLIYIASGTSVNITNLGIQLGTGTNKVSSTPIELCKIGNYQDRIYKDSGKWYLNKQIGKYTITDSDISLISSYWYNTYGQYGAGILKSNLGLPETSTNRQSLCNMSKKIDGQSYINNNTYIFNANANYVFFFSSDFDTKEHANEKLVGANVYFNLDTPTYTEITDSTLLSQLNALAKSYTGQTNISQENNDLASILNATALEEM